VFYLVDGYNFVFRLGLKKRFSLQKQREEFIKSFSSCVEKLRVHIALVFDGKDLPEGSYTRGNWKDVELIYTHHGLSADEYILAQVQNALKPKSITVVTSDRELAGKVGLYGSRVITIEEFMRLILKKNLPKTSAREKPPLRESGYQFERLLKIFEERLKNEEI